MGLDGAEYPAIDQTVVTALADELGADRAQEICDVFVKDAEEKLGALQAALDGGDAKAAASAAHSLKSGSGFVGATGVFRLCAEIERTAIAGDLEFARTHLLDLQDRVALAEEELARRHG